MEKEGRSHLLPGANLTSYGTVRDLEKWPARDRRTVGRDVINFEEHNPCVTGTMLRAVDTLHVARPRPGGGTIRLRQDGGPRDGPCNAASNSMTKPS